MCVGDTHAAVMITLMVVLCVVVRSYAAAVMCVGVGVGVGRAVVTSLAGGFSGTNGAFGDGTGSNAGFNHPGAVAVDASGNVFVVDSFNHLIRKVSAGGGAWIAWSLCTLAFADSHFGAVV